MEGSEEKKERVEGKWWGGGRGSDKGGREKGSRRPRGERTRTRKEGGGMSEAKDDREQEMRKKSIRTREEGRRKEKKTELEIK